MKVTRLLLLITLLTCQAISVWAADLNFGSTARSTALGGAGLALGDEFQSTSVINPAAPAVSGTKFRFIAPGFDIRSRGASIGDVISNLSDISDSGTDQAINLVNDFAKRDTSLTLGSVMGFAGTSGVLINAEVSGYVNPGVDARKWANSNLGFNQATVFDPNVYVTQLNNDNLTAAVNSWNAYTTSGNAADRTAAESAFAAYTTDLSNNDVSASVIWGPTLQISGKVPSTTGDLWLGTNVSIISSEYKKWKVVAQNPGYTYTNGSISNVSMDFEAVEQPTERKTSLKADVGLIYRPSGSFLQYGLVLNNFIKPRLRGVVNSQEDPMISFGIAANPIKNFVFAADLVNVNRANNEDPKLRSGAELKMGNFFALRAGYTGDNFTWGGSVFGIDLALSRNNPAMLSRLLRF